ncbi:thermonuclease family protein [Halioglobus sp. HI00S01]|uniref:thermonuclease family protein n=1 Tax=Halioglobus sp. HI00S01 TaxID=1822214 RepID=UPI0008242073|nr:thermonuclease family protein [Halioglobus sp. HI00S01]
MMMKIFQWGFAAAMLALSTTAIANTTIEGVVVSVFDGDTIEVLDGRATHKVRFAEIDCPEVGKRGRHGQPWGKRATNEAKMKLRLAGERVTVTVVDTDRYGRSIGTVFAGGLNLNEHLVAEGHCWAYSRYAGDRMIALERRARQDRLGLWSLPASERIPPWDWRRQ